MLPRRGMLISLGVVVLCLAAPAYAEDVTVPGSGPHRARHTITVVGLGRERGTPDTAELHLAIEQNAPTAQAASQQAAYAATQVVDVLRKQVGPEGRVDTAGYQLNPVYRTDPQTPGRAHGPEIVSYTAVNQLTIRTAKLDTVGTLIDAGHAVRGAAPAEGSAEPAPSFAATSPPPDSAAPRQQ